ncbi:MAG: hypothetical protein Q8P50_16930 [Bacillota bacterium]|nr:hypothetical protein [Bacillota bacterium]
MSFWQRVQDIDRRIIYVLLFVLVGYVLVKPIGLPIVVNKETQKAYDALDKIPARSILFCSADYGSSSMPELLPAQKAVLRHALGKNLRVIVGGMWPEAGAMTNIVWQEVSKDFPDKKYGVDFVNVGYKPGAAVLLERMISDAHQALQGIDFYGKNFSDLPLMSEFKTIKSAAMVFAFIAGDPGEKEWVKMVTDPLRMPLATATTAVAVPGQMPLVQSGQIVGILKGMGGAAEYELLVKSPGSAIAGMDALSATHILMVLFIILGNIGYLMTRKQTPQGKA